MFSFYTQSLQSRRETGESFLEIWVDRFPNGSYEWPSVLERGLSFGGQWTVVNESYAHNDYLSLLSRPVMVDRFRAARAGALGVKLLLNDYTMFYEEGPGSPSEKILDNVKFLKDWILRAHGPDS